MRIAVVLPKVRIAGGLFVCLQRAHRLAEAGHDVAVFTLYPADSDVSRHFPDFPVAIYPIADAPLLSRRFDLAMAAWWECFHEMLELDAVRYAYYVMGDELELEYDLLVHYDRSSSAVLSRHGPDRCSGLVYHPLPVSRKLFFPEPTRRRGLRRRAALPRRRRAARRRSAAAAGTASRGARAVPRRVLAAVRRLPVIGFQ